MHLRITFWSRKDNGKPPRSRVIGKESEYATSLSGVASAVRDAMELAGVHADEVGEITMAISPKKVKL